MTAGNSDFVMKPLPIDSMEPEIEITCRVCGSQETDEWLYPREMMFGFRDKFSYFRCATCGCLQIDQVPRDLGKYYPDNYYSLQNLTDKAASWKVAILRKILYPRMTRHKLGWGDVAGRLLCRLGGGPPIPEWLRALPRPIPLNGGVLDVGCGSGSNLLALRNCGFSNLLGVDPYIKEAITYAGGVRVLKCDLTDVQQKFSLICLNHVFEHLGNPLETLVQVRQLMAPGGQLVIAIPLYDSFAAQKYKENWVQLDAPRHVILHTRKSMEILAQKSGMKISRVVYNSTDFQFWASEQYVRDLPLRDPRSLNGGPHEKIFTYETLNEFIEEAKRLNGAEKGDQAVFVFAS